MAEIPWYEVVEKIIPYVVRISTPQGNGTGFLLSQSSDGEFFGIATAAHVINYSYHWELPIKIFHSDSGESQLLRDDDRYIILDEYRDVAVVLLYKGEIPYPEDELPITPKDAHFSLGKELGWVGFPALSPTDLCFFSGRVSSYRLSQDSYLVDGVAIHGVSGGPAFTADDEPASWVAGVVSAYIPNRATGEALPGLVEVSGVERFHDIIQTFKSLEDAKEFDEEEKNSGPESGNSEQEFSE